jgi:hypothetical protein
MDQVTYCIGPSGSHNITGPVIRSLPAADLTRDNDRVPGRVAIANPSQLFTKKLHTHFVRDSAMGPL